MKKTAGEILKEARKAAGLSQDELADLVGCGKPKISKLENGKQAMTVEWATILAPLVKLKPYRLLPDLGLPELVIEFDQLDEKGKKIVQGVMRDYKQ